MNVLTQKKRKGEFYKTKNFSITNIFYLNSNSHKFYKKLKRNL